MLSLIIGLIIIGVLMWLVNAYIPMAQPFKNILNVVVIIAVVLWLFRTVGNITDTLLIFLPQTLTHRDQGAGPMYWYWRRNDDQRRDRRAR